VISFSASDAQEGRTIAAKIGVGSNDDRNALGEDYRRLRAKTRHQTATAPLSADLIGE
jgi:hypothetical protein